MKLPLLLMLLVVILVCFFCYSQYDFAKDTGNTAFKLIFQTALSGAFTFCGLFFTFANQERYQQKLEEKKECPCFIIQNVKSVSAETELSDINSVHAINCLRRFRESNHIRTVTVDIMNIKESTWATNIKIAGNAIGVSIYTKETCTVDLLLYSNIQASKFWIEFENGYGIIYKQKVTYLSKGNKYSFLIGQPFKVFRIRRS